MKRLMLTALLAGTALTAAAAPALAQRYGPPPPPPGVGGGWQGGGYEQRLNEMESRIERGAQRGDLTRREAFQLRSDLRDQRVTLDRYQRDGLSGWERRDMDRRLDMLQARLRFERHDRDGRRDFDRRDRRGY